MQKVWKRTVKVLWSPPCTPARFRSPSFLDQILSFLLIESCTPKCNEHLASIPMLLGAVVLFLLPIVPNLPAQQTCRSSNLFLECAAFEDDSYLG